MIMSSYTTNIVMRTLPMPSQPAFSCQLFSTKAAVILKLHGPPSSQMRNLFMLLNELELFFCRGLADSESLYPQDVDILHDLIMRSMISHKLVHLLANYYFIDLSALSDFSILNIPPIGHLLFNF